MDKEHEIFIEQLYRNMYKKLLNYAYIALNNHPLAEEAIQDTFRIACSKLDELISSQNPEGWIVCTLKNVIQNIRRSHTRFKKAVITSATIEEMSIADPHSSHDFDLIYSDILSESEFNLLKMIAINQYSILEISNTLGISVKACKKRIQRAKNKLKEKIL